MIDTTKLSQGEKDEIRALYRHSDIQIANGPSLLRHGNIGMYDVRLAYHTCALLEQIFGVELFKG